MKIIIGFSKPKNHKFPVFSWLIRLIEQTPYSHVYIRWHSKGAGVDVAYEASGTSVKFVGKKSFDKKIDTIHEFEIEIDNDKYRDLLRFCMTYADTSYGLKQIFGILLVKIFGLKRNPLSEGRSSQVCSELVGAILQDVMQADLKVNLDIAGTKDIYNFLMTYDKALKIK